MIFKNGHSDQIFNLCFAPYAGEMTMLALIGSSFSACKNYHSIILQIEGNYTTGNYKKK